MLQAVKADGAMRFYMADPFCEMGLLFKCHQARVELEHPAGEAPQSLVCGLCMLSSSTDANRACSELAHPTPSEDARALLVAQACPLRHVQLSFSVS